MMQFYFLSVIMNITAGLILLKLEGKKETESIEEAQAQESPKSGFIDNIRGKISTLEVLNSPVFILVVAILSLFVGIIKLFVVCGDSPAVFGDFFPAITGILAGLTVLLSIYVNKDSSKINLPSVVKTIFIDKTYLVGFVCLIVALLHFIMPGVLFF